VIVTYTVSQNKAGEEHGQESNPPPGCIKPGFCSRLMRLWSRGEMVGGGNWRTGGPMPLLGTKWGRRSMDDG
jgi:hypothetical protein